MLAKRFEFMAAGLPTSPGGPIATIRMWPEVLQSANLQALAIACVSLAIVIFWPPRLRTYLPPPLAALVLGTLLGITVFHEAPIIGVVPTGLPSLHVPFLSLVDLPNIVQPALILALLGSIDSLLTSLVADSITRTRHNSNKELIGQGIGNMVAGLIGGLPGAGATMRTVVNVRAGGHSPISGALHALILLALVLGLAPLAERIPHAVLAGILIKVGWDIIDWGYLKRIRHAPCDKVIVMLITLGLTVFVDLITAVAVGLIFAGFVTARWMEQEELEGVTAIALPKADSGLSEAEAQELERHGGDVALVMLRGRFSYASARELVQRVGAETSGYKAIVFDFSNAAHMDTSAAIAIDELIEIASEETQGCFLAGLSGKAEATLKSLGVLEKVPPRHILPTRLEAIRVAGKK